jgi:hypothetical protein
MTFLSLLLKDMPYDYPANYVLVLQFIFDMDMSYTRVLLIKVAYRVPHK